MIRTQTNSKKTFFVFFYVLLVLLCFYPYEFYSVYFLFLPDETYITSIVFIVSTAFIALLGRKLCPPKVVLVSVVILQFLGYFICGVAHGSILGAIDNLITMLLALVLIAYIEGSIGLEAFFKRYNKWILIMAILGTLAFFLISFYGIQPIAIMQDRAGGLEARSLYNYVLTFTKSDESIIGLIRYSGFFDEPGAMAYWGIYALVMNQLFIKDKRLEVILIICLVFTLSLGYYLQVVLFLMLFHIKKKNFGQSIILFALIAAVVFGISQTAGTEDNEVYERTFGRVMAIQETRSSVSAFAVGDRTTLTENALREFKENPLFGTSRKDVAIGNNVYETLAMYGLFGTVFILFPFILLLIWAFRYKDKELFKAMIVIIVGFTHRPFHSSLLYFFIIYCILIMVYKRKRNRIQISQSLV